MLTPSLLVAILSIGIGPSWLVLIFISHGTCFFLQYLAGEVTFKDLMSEMNIGSEGSSEEDSSEESEKDEEWLPKVKTARSRYFII